MKVAQPCFHIPSCTTVTRDCFDIFDEQKYKLMAVFKETQQRVSLTTDTWTSIQRINYMVITAHWIDKNWTLHKRILSIFVQSLVIEVKILESLLVSAYMSGDCITFSLLQLIMLVQIVWQ